MIPWIRIVSYAYSVIPYLGMSLRQKKSAHGFTAFKADHRPVMDTELLSPRPCLELEFLKRSLEKSAFGSV